MTLEDLTNSIYDSTFGILIFCHGVIYHFYSVGYFLDNVTHIMNLIFTIHEIPNLVEHTIFP